MMSEKVELEFMIVPSVLEEKCYVPNKVRVEIVDPHAIFLTGFLGESGKKMVEAGCQFYFTKELAEKLIDKDIAVRIEEKDDG